MFHMFIAGIISLPFVFVLIQDRIIVSIIGNCVSVISI